MEIETAILTDISIAVTVIHRQLSEDVQYEWRIEEEKNKKQKKTTVEPKQNKNWEIMFK